MKDDQKPRQDPAAPYVDTGDWAIVSRTLSPDGLPAPLVDPEKVEIEPGIPAHLIRRAERK